MKKYLKVILSIALLALLCFTAKPIELWHALENITLGKFIILMLISFALIGVSAFKWQMFVESLSRHVHFIKLFSLYLVGYFVNLLFPSYVGGDAMRSFYVGKEVGQYPAFAATILERYTGFLAMVILAVVGAFARPSLDSVYRYIAYGIGAGVFALTFALLTVPIPIIGRLGKWPKKVLEKLKRLQEVIMQVKGNPRVGCKTMGLSFVYHLLTVANTVVAAQAVGWENPPLQELLVILPLVLLIGAIPLTPSGLGLQEGAFFHFMQLLGASPAQALGVGIVLRAKSYILALLGWLVWLKDKDMLKSKPSADPS